MTRPYKQMMVFGQKTTNLAHSRPWIQKTSVTRLKTPPVLGSSPSKRPPHNKTSATRLKRFPSPRT